MCKRQLLSRKSNWVFNHLYKHSGSSLLPKEKFTRAGWFHEIVTRALSTLVHCYCTTTFLALQPDKYIGMCAVRKLLFELVERTAGV